MARSGGNTIFWENGRESATLENVIRAYSDPLVRFAHSFVGSVSVAEELMEDALADVLLRDKKFDSEAHFRAYLYKTVRHRCLNYLRFHRKMVPLEDVEAALFCGDLETDAIKVERNQRVYACLHQLPLQYRQVLMLTYFDGFSLEEVCAIMTRSPKQVYNLLSRAKASMKQLLEKVGITHEDL